MSDLENNIRFKIKSYVRNYTLLYEMQNKVVHNNWADYLEYGTTDNFIVEIQNAGFPRHLATFLKKVHSNCFTVNDDGEISDFNSEKLRRDINEKENKEELIELSEILEWN